MQTKKMTNLQYFRDTLVAEFTQHIGHTMAPHVLHAFSQVPRDLFIESYFEQQGNTLTWKHIVDPPLEAIYRDEALVTSIDELGFPDSSSSQPSFMAAQLESLDLRAGQHVLEIGTGTGYNAALLSLLVSSTGQVVSIDINEAFVNKAQSHLQQAGYNNVIAIPGDGWVGEASHAPYDRILATCGVRTIPHSWLQQLQQDGVLIVNVLLKLASVFVRLERIDVNIFRGKFLPLDAAYMEMRQSDTAMKQAKRRGTNWSKYDALPHFDIPIADGNGIALFNNPAYCLLLQSISPGTSKHYRWLDNDEHMAFYLMNYAEPYAAVHFQEKCLTVYGNATQLVEEIRESMAFYQEQGCPDISAYELQIVDEQATLIVNQRQFALPLVQRYPPPI